MPPPDDSNDDEAGNVVDPEVLAQRRARRAESSDPPLLERATQAEQAVVSLESRLRVAERDLEATVAERDELAEKLGVRERELRTARQREYAEQQLRIEAQDRAADARAEVEREVAGLRDRLQIAEDRIAELVHDLDHARRAVAEAEEQAAAERLRADQAAARLADLEPQVAGERGERERAEAEITLLRHELERRIEMLSDVEQQVAPLRVELTALRAQLEGDDDKREADVHELGDMLEALRAETQRLAAERDELAGRLEAERRAHVDAEARLTAELRAERDAFHERLRTTEVDLRAELHAERRVAEQRAGAVAAAVEALRERIATLAKQLDERVAVERGRAARAIAQERERAAQQIARLEGELARSREVARPPAEPEASRLDPQALAALREEMERLRSAVSARQDDDMIEDLSAAAERLRVERAGVSEGTGPSVTRGGADLLPPREIPGGPPAAWMTRAFERLFSERPGVAATLVADLLPGAIESMPQSVVVDVTGEEGSGRRVVSGMDPLAPPALVLSGPAEALVPLVAGGAGRRLAGVTVTGKRRHLRRLLKARREPLTLGALDRGGARPNPGALLQLLAAAVDPQWLGGERFAVAFEVTGVGAWTVSAGATGLDVGVDGSGAEAHVRVTQSGFLPLLAGAHGLAAVEGDAAVAVHLLGLFDRAQRAAS